LAVNTERGSEDARVMPADPTATSVPAPMAMSASWAERECVDDPVVDHRDFQSFGLQFGDLAALSS